MNKTNMSTWAGLTFGVVVVGGSALSALLVGGQPASASPVLPPAVFYTVWPVLTVLLAVAFAVVFQKTVGPKRPLAVLTLAALAVMGGLIVAYTPVVSSLAGEARERASLVMTLVMLLLSVTAAFLAVSVKKVAGVLLAPLVAWMVVATNLALR